MIIGSLNIRGGNSAKRRRINRLIVKGKVDVIFIQESKLCDVSVCTARSFWKNIDVDFSFLPSVGLSGGIITLWNSAFVQVLNSFGGMGYLGIKVIWKGEIHYLVNVYSPCSIAEKRILWSKLLHLKTVFSDSEWVIAGDFNAVKNGSERKGLSVVARSREWRDFSDFINLSNLIDVPSKGKKFSWFGGDGKAISRIDRFLVSDNLVNKWRIVGQLVGDRDISDHCPVWLLIDKAIWGPKPSMVNSEWFSNCDFLPFVEKAWRSISVVGRCNFVLKEKLRILKERLRWWNINIFGKFNSAIEEGVKGIM
ncbi:uncharacterized protein LOC131596868 [Vicia villosa]|uniref:uncharacterized protein LOC131596868 n=1 Tax=Vicia villosa TaxID=3911 RepID=UPI00273A891E|nr:uncharacterized protein LOC131596868 [Vicia villosa]